MKFTKPLFQTVRAALACLFLWVTAAGHAAQPNVILVVIDDAGYGDVGYQGAEFATPNIDAIAANGVQFTNAHVTAPQCGPSRAGLITGVNQSRFGFHDNIGNVGLPPTDRVRTIGAQMQGLGYTTGVIGKWHIERDGNPATNPLTANQISRNERSTPWRNGFDYTLIHERGQTDYFPFSAAGQQRLADQSREYRLTEVVEGSSTPVLRDDFPSNAYVTGLFTNQAVDFIDRRQQNDEPFFLMLSYNAPHTPLQSISSDRDAVRAAVEAELGPNADPAELARRINVAAMMNAVDRGIGTIKDKLAQEGIADDTMIVFLSDNGGPRSPEGAYSNGDFRGVKGDPYEGGTRVPMAIEWANGNITQGGQVIDSVVSALDILPTVVGAAGGQADAIGDGYDLLPFLQGQTTEMPREDLLMQWRTLGAYRVGDDKLVDFNINNATGGELYNLSSDPDESDIVNNPSLQAQLQSQFDLFTQTQRNSISVTPTSVGPDQVPVAYSFSETGGSTIADEGFNSVKTNLTAPTSGVNLAVDGIKGSGIELDGTGGVALSGELDEWKPAEDFTAAFWVNLTGTPEVQERLIDSTSGAGAISGLEGWRLMVNNNTAAGALKIQFQANNNGGTAINLLTDDLRDLTPGQWAFVALRYDADGEAYVTLLYDSDLAELPTLLTETQSITAIGNLTYGDNAVPYLGANVLNSNKFANARFDELVLYDWSLTDEQLLTVFSNTIPEPGTLILLATGLTLLVRRPSGGH
ncbi:MAG: sulfatase-like hydrolase/transferase [Planctomycetota bacterium]